MVYETGANVHGIAFDGAPKNLGMMTSLMDHSHIQKLLEKKHSCYF